MSVTETGNGPPVQEADEGATRRAIRTGDTPEHWHAQTPLEELAFATIANDLHAAHLALCAAHQALMACSEERLKRGASSVFDGCAHPAIDAAGTAAHAALAAFRTWARSHPLAPRFAAEAKA